jgi:hypothetical protein
MSARKADLTRSRPEEEKPVLLVGNDINNTAEGHAWRNLVEHLIARFTNASIECRDDDAFPMLYERIYLQALHSAKFEGGESRLKKEIANWAEEISPNGIHQRIMSMDVDHVITTNYDYSLEEAAQPGAGKGVRSSEFREIRYSLFRRRSSGGKTVWHIHGEVDAPNSINLGYEQYSGYLQHMRDYVVSGKIRTALGGSLLSRLRKPNFKLRSWVDLLLQRDVFILGFRLDQVEMHLWWLLAFRARGLAEGKLGQANRITYFYPNKLLVQKSEAKPATERRLEMLKAFGVETVGCDGEPGKESYYSKVLDTISQRTVKHGRRYAKTPV